MLEDFSKREQLKCSEIVGEALSLPKLTQRSGSLEWKLPKNSEFVGVANLATRAALPLAGGFEPPLSGAVEAKGTSCQRVGKLPTPTIAVQSHRLLPFSAAHSGAKGGAYFTSASPASTIFCRLMRMPSLAWNQVRPPWK